MKQINSLLQKTSSTLFCNHSKYGLFLNPFYNAIKSLHISLQFQFLIFLSLVFISLNTFASVSCENYFLRTPKELNSKYNENHHLSVPTVRTFGSVKGPRGGKLIKLLLEGKEWHSSYSADGKNPQGSPDFVMNSLGSTLASFLGFKKESRILIYAPDAIELNLAIESLNTKLLRLNRKPILIRFYNSDTSHPENQSTYLANISKYNSYPLAHDGHYYIHDVSFHIGSILLPEFVIKRLQAYVIIFTHFTSQIRAQWQRFNLEEQKALLPFLNEIHNYIETRTDASHGNLTFHSLSLIDPTFETEDYTPLIRKKIKENLLHVEAKSSLHQLTQFRIKIFDVLMQRKENENYLSQDAHFKEFSSKVLEIMDSSYFAEELQTAWGEFDREIPEDKVYEFKKRAKEIKDAVLGL